MIANNFVMSIFLAFTFWVAPAMGATTNGLDVNARFQDPVDNLSSERILLRKVLGSVDLTPPSQLLAIRSTTKFAVSLLDLESKKAYIREARKRIGGSDLSSSIDFKLWGMEKEESFFQESYLEVELRGSEEFYEATLNSDKQPVSARWASGPNGTVLLSYFDPARKREGPIVRDVQVVPYSNNAIPKQEELAVEMRKVFFFLDWLASQNGNENVKVKLSKGTLELWWSPDEVVRGMIEPPVWLTVPPQYQLIGGEIYCQLLIIPGDGENAEHYALRILVQDLSGSPMALIQIWGIGLGFPFSSRSYSAYRPGEIIPYLEEMVSVSAVDFQAYPLSSLLEEIEGSIVSDYRLPNDKVVYPFESMLPALSDLFELHTHDD